MNPRPIPPTIPVRPRRTDRFRGAAWAARLAVLLAAVCASAVCAAEPEKRPAPGESQRPPLLVMFVKPKLPEFAPASRAAWDSLMRVLEGLKFRLYSPNDLAKGMTKDEQEKLLADDSTGNLMALGRRIHADKVVYSEMENKDGKRYFKLALLPSSMQGPIRFAQASYAIDASDAEMDLAVANALITLFGWDGKK